MFSPCFSAPSVALLGPSADPWRAQAANEGSAREAGKEEKKKAALSAGDNLTRGTLCAQGWRMKGTTGRWWCGVGVGGCREVGVGDVPFHLLVVTLVTRKRDLMRAMGGNLNCTV